jgi:hypothetical protein
MASSRTDGGLHGLEGKIIVTMRGEPIRVPTTRIRSPDDDDGDPPGSLPLNASHQLPGSAKAINVVPDPMSTCCLPSSM